MEAEDAAGTMSAAQRYLTLATVVLGASLYGTALLTTSTILPQMQGALSATQDEIAWAMTFNILATAVVTPMTGWLVSRFGTKRVMLWSVGCFTVATLLCGMAQSLEMLVLWRILQGGAGAPLVPLSQSILFATFPRRQHTMVMSIFGMAVAVAPAFGPVFGGYLAEMHSWRWSFYMLVPVGICATIGMAWTLPSDNQVTKVRFDWTGFIALATALAAVQLVLARGVRLDWFDSTEIVIECLIAAIAFYIFFRAQPRRAQSVRKPEAIVRPQLCDRTGAGDHLRHAELHADGLAAPSLAATGRLSRALVGQVIGSRGVGMLVGFMIAGFMSRIDPRISMAFGFGLQTAAGVWMLSFDLNVTMEILVVNSVIQGFAVGIVWVPITAVAFGTLDARHYAEASAIFHLLRNIGSSFFISLSIAEIVRTSGANYSRMTEMITPYNRALATPGLTGAWDFNTVPGLAKVAKEIARQSMMIGYLNAFTMYTVTSGLAVVFVLMVRDRKAV